MNTGTSSVVMIGATGAVGSRTAMALMAASQVERLTLLGRRRLENVPDQHRERVDQQVIDIFDPVTYAPILAGHDTAICTLGVGQPSTMSKESFVKIDKTAVLDFATACKEAGVAHFQLLSSVGAAADSRSFYLRIKGELIEELQAMSFARLSIFQPSMILTPTNRYGFLQGVTLVVWPLLTPLLSGPLRKYRGVQVDSLGQSIAANVFSDFDGIRILQWDDFHSLSQLSQG